MVDNLFMQNEILFEEKNHEYTNRNGERYESVSRLLKQLQVPFDKAMMSRIIAMKVSSEEGIPFEKAQTELLKEWDDKRDSSIDKGNYVHDGLEDYTRTGKVWEGLEEPVRYMQEIFKDYYRFYPEVMLYSHKYKVAGRTDIVLQRQKSRIPVCDFADYKSNEAKGIVFDSISRKESRPKHYNRFFLPPFDHLEACNYTIYSLQLSIYAFLALELGKVKVGKLFIVFFDNEFRPTYIPVPFMYHEAKMICELNLERKPLPKFNMLPRVEPVNRNFDTLGKPFNPDEVKEDW